MCERAKKNPGEEFPHLAEAALTALGEVAVPFVMSQRPAEMCVSVHSLRSKASDHLVFFSWCGIH